MSDERNYPVAAPGWAAIDDALAAVHGEGVPHQFASKTAYDLDSENPLPAVTVYEASEPDHWHYVTHGLTELFEKSSPNAEISGFGFELTFSLPRESGQEEPPPWPVRMLQGIGGYVLSGHGQLDTGHCIDLGSSIAPGRDSRLTGVMCVPDPHLGKIETPHGSVLFLQLFGLTADEVEHIHDWELPRKVGLVAETSEQGITDVDRLPFKDDPRTQVAWRRHDLNILF